MKASAKNLITLTLFVLITILSIIFLSLESYSVDSIHYNNLVELAFQKYSTLVNLNLLDSTGYTESRRDFFPKIYCIHPSSINIYGVEWGQSKDDKDYVVTKIIDINIDGNPRNAQIQEYTTKKLDTICKNISGNAFMAYLSYYSDYLVTNQGWYVDNSGSLNRKRI